MEITYARKERGRERERERERVRLGMRVPADKDGGENKVSSKQDLKKMERIMSVSMTVKCFLITLSVFCFLLKITSRVLQTKRF